MKKIDVTNYKNILLILDVLEEREKIRRGELYREVMKKQKQKFGRATTYQVICRDVDRLINDNIIKIIEGGPRSQILALK